MQQKVIFILRILIAVLLLQTLAYKFTEHPDSVYIFSTIGMEPYGRIGIGVLELLASICIVINKTQWLGALLSIGLMIGAVFFHLTVLGIEVHDDGGLLFGMAITILLLSMVVLWNTRKKIPMIKNFM